MRTNFLLLFAAIVLAVIFFPIGIAFTLFRAIQQGSISKAMGYLSKSALAIALSIDTLGNTVCRDLLDATLRKSGGYPFGSYWETISRVLGKNKGRSTLTATGRELAALLNRIDPEHVEDAAKSIY